MTLQRPYGRVDRKRLKRRLVDACIKGDATLLEKRAVDVEGTAVEFDDGSSVRACVVIDATGFRRKFVKHDVAFDPGFQVTYGALEGGEAPSPDKLVLMDYRDEYIGDDAAMRKRNERFPTFMYVMPISDTEIFLRRAVLVSRPGADSADLEARLEKDYLFRTASSTSRSSRASARPSPWAVWTPSAACRRCGMRRDGVVRPPRVGLAWSRARSRSRRE